MTEISVIIPSLNDADTIGATLDALAPLLGVSGAPSEILVVDGGSTDETRSAVAAFAARTSYVRVRLIEQDGERGFGSLLRLGVAYAQGRYCVVVMADARDPIDLVPAMVSRLRKGADLVLCSRFGSGDAAAAGTLPARFRLYQRVYRTAVRHVVGVSLPDSTYGFRAFNRTFVTALGLSSVNMAVCPEMVFKVALANGTLEWVEGSQRGPMIREHAKFSLHREFLGYVLAVAHGGLHRVGIRWF